eukprot:CAMPEP_0202911070 /NCGR_PEP_ID=MMETSP1392-20130828/53961_1 /ASSEMBLY_ACC=CAM_ASM_000868 /TAXON_ID=225041 /ORGANISM="Chlamydomonas chlamydogama, Strain SAG 11-48b" /LENGTH=147 /DNA_ID=CAMNT_0049601447 /DNA_START=311 /DNA_END=754 /DNA_ORIENTATION=+
MNKVVFSREDGRVGAHCNALARTEPYFIAAVCIQVARLGGLYHDDVGVVRAVVVAGDELDTAHHCVPSVDSDPSCAVVRWSISHHEACRQQSQSRVPDAEHVHDAVAAADAVGCDAAGVGVAPGRHALEGGLIADVDAVAVIAPVNV